ncbi:flagellar protein FliS [Pseudomonadota bacterium]|nr:flagellar protein FliS [Pseudomonadota bacterium]
MNNNEYVKAYQKTKQSLSTVSSSHEIIRTLMKELINSMQKIVLDIQDNKNLISSINKDITKKAINKSKSISKSLSIIYGLQTCLDFDKAQEIATNLFQLYEYCRHEIIKGFSQKNEEGIIKAIEIIKQIMEGWEEIPSLAKQA